MGHTHTIAIAIPELDDAAAMAAPTTDHLVDVAGKDGRILHFELAAHGVVMERLRRL